jgi:crossover junction endodeoxyribonuclease RuvC
MSVGEIVVLGLDPGTRKFGWGVVARRGTRLVHLAHGVIALGDGPLPARLTELERELDDVVRAHKPAQASVETIFFNKDAQAAAKLGHARGVALLVCGRARLDVHEYAPARVKRVVAAHGRAEKSQVAQMIRVILSLTAIPAPDAADALALAVTHLQNTVISGRNR